ncbi:MAG: TlpA family protein disulfide reductase [Proteobacteria bacterium]|nr:TlpA family protein disulfide reductase [Pseudomonadota bacterium]
MLHAHRQKNMMRSGAAKPTGSRDRDLNERRTGAKRRDAGTAGRVFRGFKGIAAAVMIACIFTLPPGLWSAGPKPFEITRKIFEEKAPDFVMKDLSDRKFRLSDYRGKQPVLLIFSATWCSFCIEEIPHFKSLHATYAKQGLEIVNIDIQESREKVSRFAAKYKLPYRTLLDEEGTVSGVYNIPGVPTMILVDKNGMIICRQCRTVDTLLESMLKKK